MSVVASGEAVITLTGFAITSNLGTVTTKSNNRFGVLGFSATVSLGVATVDAEAVITLTTLVANSELGHVFKWQDIDESQTPNWTDVAA